MAQTLKYTMIITVLIIWLTLLQSSTAFTPELAQLQLQIAELEAISHQLSQKRYAQLVDSDDPKSKYLLNYDPSGLNMVSHCTLKGDNINSLFIQTTNDVYLAVNMPSRNQVEIYNSKCQKLSTLSRLQIRFVLSDRGNCQTGVVFIVSKNRELIQLTQDGKFQSINKLTDLSSGAPIVGGVVRYRGKQRVQIFVGYKDGTLEVYDELGKNKLKLFIEGSKSEIKLIADHHPYPLIITTSNWISMLDTSKYIEMVQNCPYIPKIRHVISEHHYGDTVYIINAEKVYALSFQLNKKTCAIKKQFDLPVELGNLEKVSIYSNSIFMDNKVFNMTDNKLYKRVNCPGESSIQFVVKRGVQDKELSINRCCMNESCSVEFSEVEKPQESKSVFIYLTIGFIVILLISLSLTKKSTSPTHEMEQISHETSASLAEQKMQQLSRKNKQKFGKQKKK